MRGGGGPLDVGSGTGAGVDQIERPSVAPERFDSRTLPLRTGRKETKGRLDPDLRPSRVPSILRSTSDRVRRPRRLALVESRSSSRKIIRPPWLRDREPGEVKNVRAWPRCRPPVGDGARRPVRVGRVVIGALVRLLSGWPIGHNPPRLDFNCNHTFVVSRDGADFPIDNGRPSSDPMGVRDHGSAELKRDAKERHRPDCPLTRLSLTWATRSRRRDELAVGDGGAQLLGRPGEGQDRHRRS